MLAFFVSSSVLVGVKMMPWSGRTQSSENNSLGTFLSVQLGCSVLPTTDHHKDLVSVAL